jgi:hypothetical protein
VTTVFEIKRNKSSEGKELPYYNIQNVQFAAKKPQKTKKLTKHTNRRIWSI